MPLEVVLRADGTTVILRVPLTAIAIIDVFFFFITVTRYLNLFLLSINCLNIVILVIFILHLLFFLLLLHLLLILFITAMKFSVVNFFLLYQLLLIVVFFLDYYSATHLGELLAESG